MGSLPRWGIVSLLIITLLPALAFAHAPYAEANIFGDSLSDAGNVFSLTNGAIPDPAIYWNGRASNGPVWVESLAPMLGIPTPAPIAFGGTNFACYGGPAAGEGLAPPSMNVQLRLRLDMNRPITPNDLIILWGGANDIFNCLKTHGDLSLSPAVPATAVAGQIGALAGAGARKFLVANLPPLGSTPDARGTVLEGPLNTWSEGFNAALATHVAQLLTTLPGDVEIHWLDVYDLFGKVFADPGRYGFTNVTDAAVLVPAADPDEYLFWDSVHPTAAGHRFLTTEAYNVLVPEPGSIAVILLGCTALAFRRRAA